jgi:hypothetical protein
MGARHMPEAHESPHQAPDTSMTVLGRSDTYQVEPISPNSLRAISNMLLGFALAVLLPISAAVFAAESIELSAIANEQAQAANQLTLFSLCSSNMVRLPRVV